MAKTTLHDRFVAALRMRGETIVDEARTRRYTVLTRTPDKETGEQVGFYYVGRGGALRYGHTVAGSFPVPDSFKTRLLSITMDMAG